MTVADLDLRNGRPSGSYATADGNYCQFWQKRVRDDAASDAASTFVAKMQDWIRVLAPGNSRSSFEAPMIGEIAARYEAPYKQWLDDGRGTRQVGTPIEDLAGDDRGAELRAARIFSVEMMAAVDDGNGPRLGPDWRALRDLARKRVGDEAARAPFEKAAAELAKRDARIAALEEKLNALLDAQASTAKRAKTAA